MALYHKWDVKNDFAYVLQFFSLISDSLDSVGGGAWTLDFADIEKRTEGQIIFGPSQIFGAGYRPDVM